MAYPNKLAEFIAEAAALHVVRSAFGKIHVHIVVILLIS
jgi:hypothetical protein